MLKLKVKYFLSPEGAIYFPTWYEEIHKEASRQDGFINMKYEDEGNIFTIYLSFANQGKLDLWASTDKHAEFVALIEPHFIKPEEVEQLY